ncbi:hypothetical protein FB446DRAFT_809057 [Lentinula raphanica]|nr:hypothetical protein FB446DRAFT_809057 [Lentinula raphanica]
MFLKTLKSKKSSKSTVVARHRHINQPELLLRGSFIPPLIFLTQRTPSFAHHFPHPPLIPRLPLKLDEDSTSDRMDHSYGPPTTVPPNLMEPQPSNMGPPSDPWHRPRSGPSVAVTGPSPNSPNARIAEDTEQQTPAQNLPSVQPVVVGPGGHTFRLIEEGYTEPTDQKIEKITNGLYIGGSESLRQILRKLFDDVKKEGPKQTEKKRLLSDYSVYAQLPRDNRKAIVEEQIAEFKETACYKTATVKQKRGYDGTIKRLKNERFKAGDTTIIGLADQDGVGFFDSDAYEEVKEN